MMRMTVRAPVAFQGVGLHSGRTARMTIAPAASGAGISFTRTDLPGRPTLPARYDLVSDTQLCTRLGRDGVEIGTVEHAMAALSGTGVTDAAIFVDGPELPIMDGSAAPFVRALLEAGFAPLEGPVRAYKILKSVEVRDGDRLARLEPADRFTLRFAISFEDAAIGTQTLAMAVAGDAFVTQLADCRTFGRLAEVEALRRMGLGRGGSLENAIVVDRGRVLNPEGLRRNDEFVRHKMLDAVGDLALAGAPVIGLYTGVKSGHEMTNRLLRALFADPEAFALEDAQTWQLPAPGDRVRTFRPQPKAIAI
ncbi:MAG: UDP-3-O-acyl-N-acetylglucosamine deacetylase [Paracoccaceae bacterium]